jgi:hypothetical protein
MTFAILMGCFTIIEKQFSEYKTTVQYIVFPIDKVKTPIYRQALYSQIEIEDNLKRCLKIYKRKWNKQSIKRVVQVLSIGEKRYNINHKLILTMMSVESGFKIRGYNDKNKNKSIDYGLTQQNNKYIEKRFVAAAKILDKNKVPYNIKNYYDVSCNVLSGLSYYNIINNAIGTRDEKRFIGAYNVGIYGSKLQKYRKIRDDYYDVFLQRYSQIAANIVY